MSWRALLLRPKMPGRLNAIITLLDVDFLSVREVVGGPYLQPDLVRYKPELLGGQEFVGVAYPWVVHHLGQHHSYPQSVACAWGYEYVKQGQ
jgi:hypothetical protein